MHHIYEKGTGVLKENHRTASLQDDCHLTSQLFCVSSFFFFSCIFKDIESFHNVPLSWFWNTQYICVTALYFFFNLDWTKTFILAGIIEVLEQIIIKDI